MKKGILIPLLLFLGLVGLFLAQKTAFAAVSYSRSPAGFEITSPVTFNVSFDDFFSDTGLPEPPPTTNYWGIITESFFPIENDYRSNCISSSTLSSVFTLSLPISDYVIVAFHGGHTQEECETAGFYGNSLEGDETYTVFEIITGAGAHIITLASSTPTDILAYAGTLFTDLTLLIVLAIGLPIGFWILNKAIGLVKAHKK